MKIICSQWEDATDFAAGAGGDACPWEAGAWQPLRHTFTLPETALGRSGQPFFLPDALGEICVTLWCAAHISRLGKNVPAKYASRYYDGLTVGAVMQSRTLLDRQRREGLPWHAAMAFDSAVWVGRWLTPAEWAAANDAVMTLRRGAEEVAAVKLPHDVQRGMDLLIAAESRWNLLRRGDLLLAAHSTCDGIVVVTRNDRLSLSLGMEPLLELRVK